MLFPTNFPLLWDANADNGKKFKTGETFKARSKYLVERVKQFKLLEYWNAEQKHLNVFRTCSVSSEMKHGRCAVGSTPVTDPAFCRLFGEGHSIDWPTIQILMRHNYTTSITLGEWDRLSSGSSCHHRVVANTPMVGNHFGVKYLFGPYCRGVKN